MNDVIKGFKQELIAEIMRVYELFNTICNQHEREKGEI